MKGSKTHIVLIDTAILFVFIILTMISPPTGTAISQSTSVPVKPIIKHTPIVVDSSSIIINRKLDSLEFNTEKLGHATDKVNKTIVLMKNQNKELRKHAELIKEIDNKLLYDSILISDKNKVNFIKKNSDSIAIEVCYENLKLPNVDIKDNKKSWIRKIFNWRKNK